MHEIDFFIIILTCIEPGSIVFIMKDYKEIANIVSYLTDLPSFYICDGKLEVVNAMYLSTISMNRIRGILFTKPFTSSKDIKSKLPKILRYVNSFNLSFLNVMVSVSPLTTIFMGPFFLEEKEDKSLESYLCTMEEGPFSASEAKALIDSIVIKDSSFIQACAKAILSLMDVPFGSYVKVNTIRENPSFSREVPTIAENRMNEADIASHYKFERELKQLIRQGDREKLKKMILPKNDAQLATARMNIVYQNRVGGPNSIRTQKNLILTMNTLFRQAADDAGLPPVYIHSISENIVNKIERADSVELMLDVIEEMIDSYCNSINNVSLKNHSVNVVKVQRYIVNNIDKKISLADLSELTNLDESYLCRLFKRECHMTINEYIQHQRISEAKWMLESSDNSIIDISHLLGFNTQSYFCSVFKKIVGISPAKYRLNHGSYYKTNN